MRQYFMITALALSIAVTPALAASDYQTPEYSGPNARIEHGMSRNGNPKPVQSDRGALRYNDRMFETESAERHQKITREVDMRREEIIRANRDYILKTNE